MSISILGSGNMARGIGTRLVAAGQSPRFFSNDLDQAQALAADLGTSVADGYDDVLASDLVVLATPYEASLAIARELGDRLAGKGVIDISNPLNAAYDDLVTEGGPSAAERIAELLPGARVVKAFNTTFAGTLIEGSVAGQRLDVFLASDDAEAKASVAALVEAGGLVATDVGPLRRARQLEGLALLGITLQFSLGTGFGTAWKLVRP